MNTRNQLTATFLVAASTLTALADAPAAPAPALTFDGYAVATATSATTGGVSSTSMDVNAAKFGVHYTSGNISAYGSIYYNGTQTNVLDAYATITEGSTAITVGKFLSYMGYEAFDVPNMNQISYANGGLIGGPIPAYHSGVKLDYSASTFATGVAVVDSIYGPTLYKGDGDLKIPGLEAYFTYKGIKDTQIWFGIADEVATSTRVYDLWVQYNINKTDYVAVEALYKNTAGYDWLVEYVKALTPKVSLTSRISGDGASSWYSAANYGTTGGAKTTDLKFTLAPSYSFNDHFLIRAEVSYINYTNYTASSTTFFGAQSILKF
jgi:hypothetical protein